MTEVASLVRELDKHIDAFATHALTIFEQHVSAASEWSPRQRELFLEQARGRFAAMLALVEHGEIVDDALLGDLRDVGSSTALANASLAQLLLILRISRDLLIANAIRFGNETAFHSTGDVSIDVTEGNAARNVVPDFLERLIPAVDGMVDAITAGYWSARFRAADLDNARSELLLETAPFGAYEADIDGVVQYANPELCRMLGFPREDVLEKPIGEVFRVTKSSPAKIEMLLAEPPISQSDDGSSAHSVANRGLQLAIEADGNVRTLRVHVVVRRAGDVVEGYGGVVFEESADDVLRTLSSIDHEDKRSENTEVADLSSFVPHIVQLKKSAESLNDASSFLVEHASSITSDNVEAVAKALSRQSDRMVAQVDSLDHARRAIQWPDEA